MRFRKLRLSGFKSFVEPAELLIEPGLTGVVGPNGCGKSNLLEAIRWVMGEGSPKSLRGGGMEDVIFAGTATRASRSFAEVSLLVDDGAGGAETEVVRRIERGAGSAYRLNGRDVRQRDVALLFADAATGAHSPALVSQGRIAAVIAAKPVERRQMLEEAAGIAGLHVRRREAEQRLRGAEANLTRLDELLSDMETRTASLRRQARAAERYRTLSAEIRLAEARALYARWREAAGEAERAVKEARLAEAQVVAASEAQRGAAAAAETAAVALAAARAEAERARDAAQAAVQALTAATAEREQLLRHIADLDRRRETLSRDRAGEDRLAIDAAAALARLAEEEKTASAALAEVEAQRPATDAAVASAEQAARDGEVTLAQALATQAAEQADARVAQAAVAAAQQRLDRARAEVARIERERAALGGVDEIEARRVTAASRRAEAETKGNEAAQAMAAAEVEREAVSVRRDAAEADMAAARAALAAIEAEARALTKATQAAPTRGVEARATPGYERALAAVLDGDLDAPVANSGARRWAGAVAQPGDPALPEGTACLADHVTVPAALARRMAQIAVVEADGGQALAVGQRLVTLGGRVRRWDGLVSEGAGAAAAERLLRANRLAEIEGQLPPARAAAEAAQAALSVHTGRLAELRGTIETARKARAEAETAARTAQREEDAAQAAIERLTLQRSALDERLARAGDERAEADTQATTAATALAALPDGAATRARTEGVRRATEEARATLVTARARADGLARAIEAEQRRLQTARADARGWKARAGDAARRIAEMDQRIAAAETEAAALAGKPDTLAAAIAERRNGAEAATAAANSAREGERSAEEALRTAQRTQADATEALAVVREARAGSVARAEHADRHRTELSARSGERFQCPAAVLPERIGFDGAAVAAAQDEGQRHERLTADRDRLGPVNLVAETELAELEGDRDKSAAEREELGQAINRLRGSIGSLNREGRQRLLAAFEAVDGHFRRLFSTLFAGGEAHLALIDADDPLEAGLEIMAQPPGKKLSALTLLSGGEQALTAVALIFALFLTNPAPICVLDEVDAPLDDANIDRFCDLLVAMTKETDTRYLIVTHNAVTMSRMHRLFGVTMVERGISRLVSVDLGAAERLLAAE
ncbi:chromosome segregation protein SMC [Sphingomonas naphthae]|uniref:Chromosome partition protein Smc n=1 Tax=Sphingomonas naphthae TaxID=1813468 RepID=A0ABY7TQB8_9SPHN|nr:chromosome segregation protein SMC [Sphingomonas naphthae]WCT75328.1 chromosome segregation protein SMC [Sphingomonas naphthae]